MDLDDPASPDVVARRFEDASQAEELADWCGANVTRTPDPEDPERVVTTLYVPTPKGSRPALLGDWVVRLGDGEWRPFTPEDFAARFEPQG